MTGLNISNTDDIDLNLIESKVISSMGEYANAKFRPFAYYDEYLDCIRVVIKDCSVCESRIDDIFTVLENNYPKSGDINKYVGFTIKGIRHLFKKIGMPVEPHTTVTKILDLIVTAYPEATVDLVVNTIARPMAENERLTIDLPSDIMADTDPILVS